jgi:tetratricopeptide (TPR) repeat protein
MNVRHRWWLAGALLCVSVVCAQRARAQEAPVGAPPASASAQAPTLGPLQLTRPLAPETIARLIDEAESLYRSRNLVRARDAYLAIVELDRMNVHAWLRLGNLHQQAGRSVEALDAYRQASLTIPATAADAESRGKALLNIALLNVAQASRAIDELDAMNAAALKPQRDAVGRQIGAERRRANAAAARGVVSEDEAAVEAAGAVERRSATPHSLPAARAAAADPPAAPPRLRGERATATTAGPSDATAPGTDFEPYTVDRWVARARRAPVRAETARSAITVPITETPLPELPRVEVIRGVRSGAAVR